MTADCDEKCIYCKSEESSQEHVAPRSLGGNCTLHCVCNTCNMDLSLIDQALAEHSPVAFSKILHTPSSAFATYLGGHATLQAEGGREIGVRLGNQMSTEVRPQLFSSGDHVQAVASDRDGLNDLIRFIDKEIARGRLASTRVIVSEEAKEPRFLMHRSEDALVSCSSSELAAQFLGRLQEQWTEIKTKLQTTEEQRSTHSQRQVLIRMALWPNEEYRGVTKMAFETLALLRGPAFVLQKAFDPVREYIKGDVRLPDPKPEEIQVDTRFVKRLGNEFRLKFTEQHGVLLFSSPPNLVAFVLLYGTHPYLVRLATLDGERRWMRGYEFSYTKQGHRELDEVAMGRQILQVCPEAFGISRQDARELLKRFEADLRSHEPSS